MWGDSASAQYPRCRLKILKTRVHARNQVGLLNNNFLFFDLGKRMHCLHGVGSADLRSDLAEIDHNASGVDSILIGARRRILPVVDVGLREALDTLIF